MYGRLVDFAIRTRKYSFKKYVNVCFHEDGKEQYEFEKTTDPRDAQVTVNFVVTQVSPWYKALRGSQNASSKYETISEPIRMYPQLKTEFNDTISAHLASGLPCVLVRIILAYVEYDHFHHVFREHVRTRKDVVYV